MATFNGAFATLQGWCPWCADHMNGGGWGMMFGWTLIFLVAVLVIVGLTRGGWSNGSGDPGARKSTAEDILREEYARGKIDEDTFRRRLEELRST